MMYYLPQRKHLLAVNVAPLPCVFFQCLSAGDGRTQRTVFTLSVSLTQQGQDIFLKFIRIFFIESNVTGH